MAKFNKMNPSKNTGNLWTTMIDPIKSGNPIVVKGVVAVGIVMMFITATRTIGQMFQGTL